MKPFALLWNTPYTTGGWVSFSVHLHLLTGAPILRLANVDQRPRELGHWGVQYQNATLDTILSLDCPILVGSINWKIPGEIWDRILKLPRAWCVFHDESEFRSMPHTRHIRPTRCIIMREYNYVHYPTATLLPQPYKPRYTDAGVNEFRPYHAISTARLDGMKGTERIVMANRLLRTPLRVKLLGTPNRLWVFGKKKKLPELQGLKGYPARFGAGADLHRIAEFGVDMTEIGKDHGVQYTLLEALDAGAIPIVSSRFTTRGVYQHAASTPVELAKVLSTVRYAPAWALSNRAWLNAYHAPARVARAWLSTLCG
jgi:hypothetical protein